MVLILCLWVFVSRNQYDGLTKEFKTAQDSLNSVVDSLQVANIEKDSVIGELHIINLDLNYKAGHQKEKVITITKWVDSSKITIDSYNEQELISFFNNRYPEDTTNNLLPISQAVLIGSAKDLTELEGAKQILIAKDSIISLTEEQVVVKDKIINEYKGKEDNYKTSLDVREKQIKDWEEQYRQLELKHQKLKTKNKLTKAGTAVIIGGLIYLLVK
jgi:hypothetical protein